MYTHLRGATMFRQTQDHSLRPLTTAHLAQTMSLLVLSNQELHDRVITELASNPALEMLDERICPGCHKPLSGSGPCPLCSRQVEGEEPIVFLSPRDSYRPTRKRGLEDQLLDQEPAAPEELSIFVLRQLAAELKPEDRHIAVYILSSLDEDGFLTSPPPYIAQATRSSLPQVMNVIQIIQKAAFRPKPRLKTKLSAAKKQRRYENKLHRSRIKKMRRPARIDND